MSHKITFIITEENDRQLLEIQKRYGLAKTDSVRRGIALLYDYLINDIQPENSTAAEVEPLTEPAKDEKPTSAE